MFIPTRHFSPTKLFISRKSELAVMLNPKVLTTFTAALLTDGYREFLGRDDPSENRYRVLNVARRFPIASLSDYLYFIRRPEEFKLYGFVRNPFGRIASAWKNKLYDGHHNSDDGRDSGYPRSIQQRHLRHIRKFATLHRLEGSETHSLVPIETFVRYAAAQSAGKRDHHWDAQTRVLMVDRLDYARIFKIESELEDGFLEIGKHLGFPDEWVRERLQKPRNPSATKAKVFDAALAELALPLCQDDLDRFGYAADSWMDY